MALTVLVRFLLVFRKESLFLSYYSSCVLTEFDCPGDGMCSNQGTCDDITGTCICDTGVDGNICQCNEL